MKTTESVSPSIEATKTAIRLGLFTGMLSGFQRLAYRDLQFAGFEKKTAHKIAVDYASQLGNAMRNDEGLRSKISKANKDGICKIAGAFSDKLKMDNACAIIRVVQVVSDFVNKEKLLSKYAMNLDAFNENIQSYIADCNLWASEQIWEVLNKDGKWIAENV